jgi:hypothetical protein
MLIAVPEVPPLSHGEETELGLAIRVRKDMGFDHSTPSHRYVALWALWVGRRVMVSGYQLRGY